MAFQIGDIKISGTIDGFSFYNSVFGWLVRQKGGPTRKQFKKSPSFARARENSNEFTLCSRTASAIRTLIIKHTKIKDKTLYHRLIKLMRLLADADQTSVRGQRDPLKGIHSTQGKLLLKDFEITPGCTLYTILVSAGLIQLTPAVTDPESYQDAEVKTKPLPHTLRRKKTSDYIRRNITSPVQKQYLFQDRIQTKKKIFKIRLRTTN